MSLAPGDRLTLRIRDIAFGGEGVADVEGFVVFVPFVAEGEVVVTRANFLVDSESSLRASLESIGGK